MAKHEFGMMQTAPKPDQVFQNYEPEKYSCIGVDDTYIEPLLPKLSIVDCYWHSLACPRKNINYCGITLIPPDSMDLFMRQIVGTAGTEALRALLEKAKKEHRFVIHFGI